MTLDGKGVASHVGSLLLAELADRVGFDRGVSAGMGPAVKRPRRRDPGVVLTHLAVMLADGGDALSDLAVLRNQPDLVGQVASDSTAFRLLSSGWVADAVEQVLPEPAPGPGRRGRHRGR